MDPKGEELFKHSPLPPGTNIRVIALEPSRDFNSEIRCRLAQCSLAEARGKYEALSYVWGSPIRDVQIICNGGQLCVTKSCLLALRYLRKKSKVRSLWIDAICIDQSSDSERGHQVELMGEIYQSANNVIIWLGEEQPGTRRAFQRAHNFYRLTRVVKKAKSLLDSANLTGEVDGRELPPIFLSLLHHPWFRRVWTLQELLMAYRATIYCGHSSIPWEAFIAHTKRAIFLDDLCENVISTNFARLLWQVEAKIKEHIPTVTLNVDENGSFYDATSPTMAGSHEKYWLATIVLLLRSSNQRFCSEPLDHIYGLYGLFRKMGFTLPRPDYHKTSAQVFQEFTFSYITISRSLTPIYGFVEHRIMSDGPSWALDWGRFDGKYTFIRFWGIRGETRDKFREDFKPSIDEGRLALEGILYGPLYPFGTPIPKKQEYFYGDQDTPMRLELLYWLKEMLDLTTLFENCPNGQLAWEAFFIAYFKGYSSLPPEVNSQNVLQSMILLLLQSGMVSSDLPRHTDLVKQGAGKPSPKQLSTLTKEELYTYIRDDNIMQAFTEKLTYTARNCSEGTLFRTSRGWIGISMCPFKQDDLLALLHGSSVPAILRPMENSYQLVGFASTQGIPDNAWPIKGDEEGLQGIILT